RPGRSGASAESWRRGRTRSGLVRRVARAVSRRNAIRVAVRDTTPPFLGVAVALYTGPLVRAVRQRLRRGTDGRSCRNGGTPVALPIARGEIAPAIRGREPVLRLGPPPRPAMPGLQPRAAFPHQAVVRSTGSPIAEAGADPRSRGSGTRAIPTGAGRNSVRLPATRPCPRNSSRRGSHPRAPGDGAHADRRSMPPRCPPARADGSQR